MGLRLSVVIPTYQRPAWVRRAVLSLASQVPPPFEVIAVARVGDTPTEEAIAELQAMSFPFPLRKVGVSVPGFMPPVFAGIREARGDVVAFMDDDAEAVDGWVSGLLRHYQDPRVGGAGGRCINMDGDRPAEVPRAERVGYVTLLGRFVGKMYMRPTFEVPVPVDFLMGGCMSYLREVAERFEADLSLNENVAFGYEVDLGLQARRGGWRLIFDPSVAIRHYSAPRAASGMRSQDDREAVRAYAHNHARVALRRLPPWHAALAFAFAVMIGERRAPGILAWLCGPVALALGFTIGTSGAALQGRIRALRRVLIPASPNPP